MLRLACVKLLCTPDFLVSGILRRGHRKKGHNAVEGSRSYSGDEVVGIIPVSVIREREK